MRTRDIVIKETIFFVSPRFWFSNIINFKTKQNNSQVVLVIFTRVALGITSLTGQHTFLKIEHLCLHVYVL